MGTYIGKLQLGNDSANLISFGDTLYGICDTANNIAIKNVIIDNLDRLMNGIQIRVRFTNGNVLTSSVFLQINSGQTINNYIVTGDCTCSGNEVITFTWEEGNVYSYWRVTGNTLTQTTKDYVGSIVAETLRNIDANNIIIKTTAEWQATPQYIPPKDTIMIYSDIPGIKIADGLAYGVDQPFVGHEIFDALTTHINNTNVHVTAEEKTFWNNKLNCDISGERLILNRQ